MSDITYSIEDIRERIIPVAEKYGVNSIYLFGSYAKGNATNESDIDFVIDKGDVRGIQFAELYAALEDVLEKSIDLVTFASLDEKFRKGIADEEVLLYERS